MKKPVEVVLVFDIGKTNKKYYLFDDRFQVRAHDEITFAVVTDDDGEPADDIGGIESWIMQVIDNLLSHKDYQVIGINFSTYGASFVHLGFDGRRMGPLYNYTKSFPFHLFQDFTDHYDKDATRVMESGSPGVGMLNSGFQLFWLKHHKPEFFRKIRFSLHFPQYLSYLLTGVAVSDFTSLGCHTALWNYKHRQYDHWVRAEKIERNLAPLVSTFHSINCQILDKNLKVGVGIHDSSAALLPYLSGISEPFILISTGTWSISLNPFGEINLTAHDIANGCLYYMRPEGKPVMAQRLFLGYEFESQIEELAKKYKSNGKTIKKIKYNLKVDKKVKKANDRFFQFKNLGEVNEPKGDVMNFDLERAYHQLISELVNLQIEAVQSIVKNTRISKIIIDGGFIKNEIFLQMMANRLSGFSLYASKAPAGSALGAAIAVMPQWWSKKILKKNYALRKIKCK